MANSDPIKRLIDKRENIKRLKAGVEEWNQWRKENYDIQIDLMGVNFTGANLRNADLSGVDLLDADLRQTDLRGADLRFANLISTSFVEADLGGADLTNANLGGADLKKANLVGADLEGVNFDGAILTGADLGGAELEYAHLVGCVIAKAKFNQAFFGGTTLADLDLSQAMELDYANHTGSSSISTDTLKNSKGRIPEVFLRGCGLSDWEIESAKLYNPGLSSKEIDDILYRMHDLRATQAIQINWLFISYSHKDCAFVDAMEKRLDGKGIRFWRDTHDATAGRLEKVVDRAMRQNPTVLLVLSENSVQSDWVEHEARSARELEKELKRDVLCPVALDDSWKNCSWPARLREQIMEYNILDFSNWKDETEFTRKFAKLVEGLDLFYKEK